MSPFPATMHSVVLRLRSDDPAERATALDRLLRAYTRPIYKHLRLRWKKTSEDAEDLVQDFFARAVERSVLDRYDPRKGRFRTYLRTCVDRFVSNAEAARGTVKRGGNVDMIDVSTHEAERELDAWSHEDVESVFEREWARSVFAQSVAALESRLRAAGKGAYFEVFKRLDLADEEQRPTYARVAEDLGLAVTDVTNYLHAARKELRRGVLETLRELTANEEEFRVEVKALLGVDP